MLVHTEEVLYSCSQFSPHYNGTYDALFVVSKHILSQNGTLIEYPTVSDAKGECHVPPSHLSVQSTVSRDTIVVDIEGYGVVQNVAKSPQKIRSMGSQRNRVTSDIPEPMHYAEVNGCCAQTKPPLQDPTVTLNTIQWQHQQPPCQQSTLKCLTPSGPDLLCRDPAASQLPPA